MGSGTKPIIVRVLRSAQRRRTMLTLRLSAAFLVCFAFVQSGTAQQSATPAPQTPATQRQGNQGQATNQTQPNQGQASQDNQNGQQGNGQPVFRGGIDFVRVDVIVSDKKAQPVTNLTQADFDVFEDG